MNETPRFKHRLENIVAINQPNKKNMNAYMWAIRSFMAPIVQVMIWNAKHLKKPISEFVTVTGKFELETAFFISVVEPNYCF